MPGKFVVHITQRMQYQETITGYFDDLEEAQEFIKAVVMHFEKTKATISYMEKAESEDTE